MGRIPSGKTRERLIRRYWKASSRPYSNKHPSVPTSIPSRYWYISKVLSSRPSKAGGAFPWIVLPLRNDGFVGPDGLQSEADVPRIGWTNVPPREP